MKVLRHIAIALMLCPAGELTGAAQTSQQPPPSSEQPPPGAAQEAGGRLVVSGETVIVKGDVDKPAADSSVATKIDTPLLETPRSVSIMDRRTLDDLAAVNISQAHDYTVGLTPLDERGPAVSRGFPVDFYDLRRDGLRTYGWSVREPVALDRIQYLRGAAALFYGDGSPGGLVNLVLKKPLPVRQTEIGVGVGELDFRRLTVDTTGPLDAGRSTRYRVIGAAEWLDNGYANDERRLTFLPTISFDAGRKTTLSFDTELYSQRGRNYRRAVPVTDATQRGDFSQVPWNVSIAGPDDGWTGDNIAPGVRADVQLSDRTSLHAAARFTKIDGDLDLEALLRLAPDNRTAIRYHYREISTWNEYQTDVFAALVRSTGAIQHRIVGGLEYGFSTTDSQIGVGAASTIDIFQPVYGPPPSAVDLSPVRYDVTRLGLYGSDQIRLSKTVSIVPGVRASYLRIFDHVAASLPESASQALSTDTPVSPSLGVVVLPRPWFSVYSNYIRGFATPSPGSYLEDGRALAISTNDSFEAGMKADLAGQRLIVSAAAFHIGQTNVPELEATGFYRQVGAAESRGLELEAIGRLSRGLSARAGYALTRTEITRDVSGFTGNELPNAPPHLANLWLRYQSPGGRLSSLMIGGGIVHVSDRFTNRDNAVVVPGYTRFDLSGSYDLREAHVRLGLVAENVTNLRYVTSGTGAVFFAGTPRRVALQMTSRF